MWEFIDKVVYINLDSRYDRRVHMEKMTSCFGDKVVRFSAIPEYYGWLGCSKSHVGVLKLAIENNWKNVLILEDDAEWNMLDEGYSKLEHFVSNPYDVIMLGGSFLEYDETYKLKKGSTTSAYLVNNHYFQTLLNNYEEGLGFFVNNVWNKEIYSLDRWWNKLQERDNWYIISPCLVYQTPSYSDIEYQNADSRCLFEMTKPEPPPSTKSRLTFQNVFRK